MNRLNRSVPHEWGPRWLAPVLSWGLAACVAGLVLVGWFHYLVFSQTFHVFEHQRLKTAQRFTQAAPMTVVSQLQAYFRSPSLELIQHPLFSYRERLHYQEVKHLLLKTQAVWSWGLLGLIGLTLGLCVWLRGRPDGVYNALIAAAKQAALILVAIVMVSGVATLDFETQFLRLHLLIFESRHWLLPSYAATVQLFPTQYFLDFSRVYAALAGGSGLLLWGVSSGVNWAVQLRQPSTYPATTYPI